MIAVLLFVLLFFLSAFLIIGVAGLMAHWFKKIEDRQ